MTPEHDERWWADPRWLWVGIGAICLAALLSNLAVWLLLSDSNGDTSSSSAGVHVGHVQPSGSDAMLESAVADCRARWQQQREPLRAAQASMKQWRVHIDAMNELVAGNITLAQASTFWNRTRMGAMHRIMRFEQDVRRYGSTAPACSMITLQQADGTTIPDGARHCIRAAVAGDRVLATVETALTTWQRHVHDMEMLRQGNLSPGQATQAWQMMWHMGQHQLAKYRHANRHALYLRCV